MASLCIQLIFFLFLFPISALSQKNGIVRVPLGSTLTAGETSASPWLSPSGDFAFGFQEVQHKDLFLLSIWYHKIPDKTVVWFVNSTNPVPRGSTVKLDPQTGLVHCDPRGLQLWSANVDSAQIDHGFMNDTGNFVLKGNDDSWLWESFKHPADTILPNQELKIGDSLSSRKSATSFSRGRFYLRFRDDGNLVLVTDDDAEYYNSKTSDSRDPLYSGSQVTFDGRGAMYIRKKDNQTEQLNLVSIPRLPPASENYHRATIDFDGVFTHYYHPRTSTGNPNWKVLWYLPPNICISLRANRGSGACGFNNICNLKNGRPVCECPKRYVLLDPDDTYGSCIPNSTLSCAEVDGRSAENLYDFEVVYNIDWPLSEFAKIHPSNERVCVQNCLRDCFCAVAIYKENNCWKHGPPLYNGKADKTIHTKAFIKYRKSDGSKPKDRGTFIRVEPVLLGTSFLVNLIFITTACLGFYLMYRKKRVISFEY
ncbi:G-type lectin S-receptor-like serine/threonine-protein kinase LECRK3 [Coffea arabica]|uniref:G-type lectin S-receptor-like serine/threonine-protein kinase LECRK3 n=1 Tax=Coffea arabica TaxID=13443 RepID=A0A6P6TH99_COFAR|nr:G-type lectin S-receptor-like serine/threonine-protein kinase RLK1 [Coffea arabica]